MRVEKSFEAMVVVGISGVAVVSCTEKPAEPAGAVESHITIYDAWEWIEAIGFDTPSPGVFKITGVVTLTDDDAVYSDVNIESLAGEPGGLCNHNSKGVNHAIEGYGISIFPCDFYVGISENPLSVSLCDNNDGISGEIFDKKQIDVGAAWLEGAQQNKTKAAALADALENLAGKIRLESLSDYDKRLAEKKS